MITAKKNHNNSMAVQAGRTVIMAFSPAHIVAPVTWLFSPRLFKIALET